MTDIAPVPFYENTLLRAGWAVSRVAAFTRTTEAISDAHE